MSESERTPMKPVEGLGRGARTAGLMSPPGRRPPKVTVELPAGGGVADDDKSTGSTPAPTTPARGRRAAQERPRGTTAPSGIRPISLSLPASLVAQVRSRAKRDQITQPEVLMDALTATKDQLADLVASRAQTVSDGLFVRRRQIRPEVDDQVAVLSMRVMGENLAAIDDLVTSAGAPSRSALCAAALRVYLSAD